MRRFPLLRGPIARRLFLFNIMLVFMPVAGFFSLSTYEDRLLADLESSLVQQGRFLAAWLQESPLTRERAIRAVSSLEKKHTARIRVVDGEGTLLADSSNESANGDSMSDAAWGAAESTGGADTAAGVRVSAEYETARKIPEPIRKKAEKTLLYRALSLPVRIARKYLSSPPVPLENADYYSGKTTLDGGEITRALSGSYGAITRISSGGQNSVTLYSAIPIMREDKAEGAVLVSQSTYRILASLYAFRLETGKIFMLSLIAAALVSLILAVTISRPLSRLREEAESAIAHAGHEREPKAFHLTGRNDEIDRLSASLTALVGNLAQQVALSENFASDAAHELRNRISGIRNAAELIPGASESELERVASLIAENSCRMERVVASLRELSRIEADSRHGETGRVDEVIGGVVSAARGRYPNVHFALRADAHFPTLPLSAERLEIAIENLVENAASFSPPGGKVSVELKRAGDRALITVRDEGPGIPAEHLGRVFDRFFSWRPDSGEARGTESRDAEARAAETRGTHHAGVGLSLVEAIMRKAGGAALCANGDSGGAIFTLDFPA